jgi:hypothetical protein
MFILFIEYEDFNLNFEYLYKLFYYLNIKIKLINHIDIKDYIINNHKNENIYIFYEIFDEELFIFINTKYNKIVYYFIENYKNINQLENKYKKNNFILLSNSYVHLIDFPYTKILLNNYFSIEDCVINEINNIFILKNDELNNYLTNEKINFEMIELNQFNNIENNTINIQNSIIIINEILEEKIINKLIFQKNLLLIKNFNHLELYFFYNHFIIFNDLEHLQSILLDIKKNQETYFKKNKEYLIYLHEKLNINHKNFFKKIDEIENPNSYNHPNSTFGFIILRHVNNEISSKLWIKSIKNIRKYYRNKIYIIDDNSNTSYLQLENQENQENQNDYNHLENVFIIQSEYKQRGELLPYYYLYKNKLFEQCIILHDSVFIHKYIDFTQFNESIYYLWHFGHEANDLINEKQMIQLLKNDKIQKIEECYDAQKWYGCFGIQTIIKYEFIETLEKEFNIFKLLDYIDNRQKRMNFERIFSVLCILLNEELTNQKSIYGNIKEYIKWEYTFKEYLEDENNLDLDLIKTWNGR